MTHPSAPNGRGWPSQNGGSDDGWGPSTAVQAGQSKRIGRAFTEPSEASGPHYPRQSADAWSPAGPLPAREQRATRMAERRTERSVEGVRKPRERGVPWWAAILVLVVIAAIGGLIDTVGSIQVQGGFNIGVVVASVVAILIVKRSHMFPIVISPPIVYSLAAMFQLYVRSRGLADKGAVLDEAANYLVYGFPAIAAATAAVLIVAGVRLITHK